MVTEETYRSELYRGPGGRLTLNLSDHGLHVLPPVICDITELQHLVLNNNHIKELPPGIG